MANYITGVDNRLREIEAAWKLLKPDTGALHRAQMLHVTIAQHFSNDEMARLAAKVGIDMEDIGGEGRTERAFNLAMYANRIGRYTALVEAARQERPGAAWPEI